LWCFDFNLTCEDRCSSTANRHRRQGCFGWHLTRSSFLPVCILHYLFASFWELLPPARSAA
jgi:hypothetical protein